MDKVIFENKKVILKNEEYFDVEGSLDCGQAFRWKKDQNNKMIGVVGERTIKVYREEKDIILEGCDKQEFLDFWKNYFDLDFDYLGLINDYSKDEHIKIGAKYAFGMRVLNQPKFETIISFIISANNNIKRIKGIIERICEKYGHEIENGLFSFPTPRELENATEEDFLEIGAGYRAGYLVDTIKTINEGFDFESISDLDYEQAKAEIQKLKGVGPKVADCILLYAYGFRGAFPVDVWIKRVVETLYFDGESKNKKDIENFAKKQFGDYAGIIQLFLFNYARNCL